MRTCALFFAAAAALGQAPDFRGSFTVPLDGPALKYGDAPKEDPVAQLQARLASGEVKLAWDAKFGYLPAVLKALGIPAASQGLVFSKTSFQLARIAPETPRAIYFSDTAYVGFVPGGDLIEMSAADPERGGMFYSLAQRQAARPAIERRDECLQCHASPSTTGVPGHFVRSVKTDGQGYPLMNESSYVTDHRSPFEERWGGWYVSGTHGSTKHMGNAAAGSGGENVVSLRRYFDTARYLTPHSDIVALMVLEHQTKMHNLLARAGVEARSALLLQAEMNAAMKRPAGEMSESTERRLANAAEIVVRYMLFADEARLKGPVRGTSDFAKVFAAQGPRDGAGRSLRELDLEKRLFKYPCSYLIYSEAFARLPGALKERILARVDAVATGKDRSQAYAGVAAEEWRAVKEILDATLKGR